LSNVHGFSGLAHIQPLGYRQKQLDLPVFHLFSRKSYFLLLSVSFPIFSRLSSSGQNHGKWLATTVAVQAVELRSRGPLMVAANCWANL
jgi:hypothetical protein